MKTTDSTSTQTMKNSILLRRKNFRIRVLEWIMLGVLLLVSALMSAYPAHAVVLVNETFKNSSAPGWTIGDDAVLTSGGVDPNGDGFLRLTPNDNNKRGFAIYNTSIPTDAGVKVSFDFTAYGGGSPGADGIAFFLLDGTTANPHVGAYGGSLGYANRNSEEGVPNGYVGIGLDEYGNYSNPTESRNGGIGFTPEAVAIRGSGNGLTGYDYIGGTGTLSPTLDFADSSTRPDQTSSQFRRATITITPDHHITVQVQFGYGTTPITEINNFNLDAAPGQAALPSSFKFGFTSSTGGSKNFHEIRNFVITTAPFISGTVYNDANHDSTLNNGETGTGLTGLYAKLVPTGNSSATAVAAVDPTTGAYQLASTAPGSYKIILTNSSDPNNITPYLPPGYIGTEAPNQTRLLASSPNDAANISSQNFGLYHGSIVNGTVFKDTGVGSGGIANNGIKDGTEPGIGGVMIKATSSDGATTYDTFPTRADGTYTLYVPSTATSTKIVETNPNNFLSTGATLGNTSGTYDRPTDTITFTPTAGTAYTNVNFGDVPLNTFLADNATTSTPGNTVLYKHAFTAGSGGTVAFNVTTPSTQTPAGTGFTQTIYLDTNGNGAIDAGEPILSPATQTTVVAGQVVNIIVKEDIPASAPNAAKDIAVVNAVFTYTNATPALSSTISNTDTTTVTTATGLSLVKSVSAATAKPGDDITYTIVYTNTSDKPMTGLVINDFTPGFTTFVSAAAGAPPTGLNAPVIATPAAGGTGALTWTFGGTLAPQATGNVTFVVKVNP